MHATRGLLLALLLVLLLAGCAGASSPATQQVDYTRLVDLSHTVTQNMPHMPASPPTRIERNADGRVQAMHVSAGNGTTLRLPPGAPHTLDQLSPHALLRPAVMLDMRDTAQDNPAFRLSAAAIEQWEAQHGPIPAGGLVLVATGWDVRWGDANAYLNLDNHAGPQVPGLSAEAVALLEARAIDGVGIDSPMLGATGTDWLLLENLTNLEQLPATGATLSLGPLKVQGSQVSPVRVLALLP